MAEFLHLPEGETTTVDNAGMIVLIDDGYIGAAYKGGNRSQVGLITGCKDQGSLLSEEPG